MRLGAAPPGPPRGPVGTSISGEHSPTLTILAVATATASLPLTETIAPTEQAEVAVAIAQAFESGTPIYPIGGGTSLDGGLPATREGLGLSLTGMSRVIDYPARDMTITVEAGITLDELGKTLATERQWLPIDAPQPQRATLGGLVATGFSGPRRYGWGLPRDYVIGISAVDGRGMAFKGGGRVVKNVAGYDFCKLLTGSCGTLGVITQITLKVKPLPEASALMVCDVSDFAGPDFAGAERLLAALVNSMTTPSAIALLAGPAWNQSATLGAQGPQVAARLCVGLEGTAAEVDWMLKQLAAEWQELGAAGRAVTGAAAEELWTELREFPAGEAPLVLKATLRPSATSRFVKLVLELDRQASIQAHAGTGVVLVRFAEVPQVSRILIGKLQPFARAEGGHVVVLSSPGGGLTRQAVWGGTEPAIEWMTRVKQQFDPRACSIRAASFIYRV